MVAPESCGSPDKTTQHTQGRNGSGWKLKNISKLSREPKTSGIG
jgi:hypothetical protein